MSISPSIIHEYSHLFLDHLSGQNQELYSRYYRTHRVHLLSLCSGNLVCSSSEFMIGSSLSSAGGDGQHHFHHLACSITARMMAKFLMLSTAFPKKTEEPLKSLQTVAEGARYSQGRRIKVTLLPRRPSNHKHPEQLACSLVECKLLSPDYYDHTTN